MDAVVLLQPVGLGSEPPLDLQDFTQCCSRPPKQLMADLKAEPFPKQATQVLNVGKQNRPGVTAEVQPLQQLRPEETATPCVCLNRQLYLCGS